jgi:hypothetical protein
MSRLSIGVMVEDRRVAICVLASTLRGRRPVASEVHDCGEDEPQTVLQRLLEPWIAPGRGRRAAPGPWVQAGIPEDRAFQAVVPITSTNRNGTAQTYFLEAVQATNVRAEDRTLDLVRLELNKQPFACVAAAPAGPASRMFHMLSELGARVGLVEPAPSALFRAGAFHARAPRGSLLCVRFFLGTERAIGVLAAGAQPLLWHAFALEPGQETAAVLAAYSTLWMLGRNSRIPLPIDTVVVHGRPELMLVQDPEEFRQRTGARLIRCREAGYGPESAALGLALADPLSEEPRLDLARGLKPAPLIRDVFPWAELALQGAILGGVSLLMLGMASDADARLRSVQAGLAAFPWAKTMDQAKLDGEKKVLEERTKMIAAFRGSRVPWSAPLRTIAASAPESTVIRSLTGEAESGAGARSGKGKRQLVVGFETPMAQDGSLPEIDGFLASLRGEPPLARHFPLMEVTGLTANSVKKGQAPSASYNIICLPKAETAPAPAKKAAGPAK